MKKHLKYLSLLLVLLTCVSVNTKAERVTIKAKLDSAHLVMGRTTTLHVEVVKDRGMSGYFPMFAEGDNRPYVGLNGDSVELSRRFTSDTIELGSGRTQINYNIPLQAFDSGFYYLPPLQYVCGVDTAESNRVALKVLPVRVKPDEDIEGFTDVADAPDGSWTDKLPDFLVYYWWLILIIIVVIAAAVWGYLYYKRHGALLPKFKPQLSPYEAARQSLTQLQSKHLWQDGKTEEYFVELTGILRRYISARFKVSAPEMTTQQFLEEAGVNPRLSAYSGDLKRLLELADFVKFARGQALPDENTEAYNIVSSFVDTTRPTAEEEEARKAEEQAGHKIAVQKARANLSAKSKKPSRQKKGGKANNKRGKEVRS